MNALMDHESEQEIEQAQPQDEQEDDDAGDMLLLELPLWIRNSFPAIPHRDVLHQQQQQAIRGQHNACEECSHRVATFLCTECAISLCMSCTDAIHIVRLNPNGVGFL